MQDLGNLKDNLLKKYERHQLASVYLAKYPESTDPLAWGKDFIRSITPLEDHPDVLWVTRSEKENEYKVDSTGISDLLKFLNYRPYELKKKFIMVMDAHLISTIVSNKLLKILEELPENFCLFLFAPAEENLLPTVESRAIKILMPPNLDSDYMSAPLPEYNSAQELLNALKESEAGLYDEKRFIEERLKKALEAKNFKECAALLENLKHYSVSDSFNNSKLSRLSLFFS